MHMTRWCWNCGADLGEEVPTRDHEVCGERECQLASRDARYQEREEAHEQLDRELGWY